MIAVTFAITAALAAAVLWLLTVQHRRGRGSHLFVIAALPAAFLIPVVVAGVGIWAFRQGFHDVASAPRGPGTGEVALLHVCREMLNGFRFAALGVVATVVAAGALQTAAEREATDQEPAEPARLGLPGVFLLLALVAVIPSVAYVAFVFGFPRYLMDALAWTLSPGTAPMPAGGDLHTFSRNLSIRIVLGTLGGITLTLLLAAALIGTLIAGKPGRFPAALRACGWAMGAVTIGASLWLVVSASRDIARVDRYLGEKISDRVPGLRGN